MTVEIATIPCLSDNYAFVLHDPDSRDTVLVDAPESAAIERALAARGWRLTHILLTHHHWDHVDGVQALRAGSEVKVIGAQADRHRLPKLDAMVAPGQTLSLCSTVCEVIDVPGHTVGHVAFHFPALGAAFTGDSLMALGCGRLFEGTPEQMWASLSRLSELPDETVIYSGHEYTQTNARFALTIEPKNSALISRTKMIEDARSKGQPTVPSKLSEEKATNPFLRAHLPEVKSALRLPNAADSAVFAEIRSRKDNF